MCATEHGVICITVGHVAQRVGHCLQAGQQHLLARGFELQGVAGVVDVFAGAGKVNEFQRLGQF